MNILDEIKQELLEINRQTLKEFHSDYEPIKLMAKEVKKLQSWLLDSSTSQPATDKIKEAVFIFYKDLQFSNFRDARFACWGASTPYDSEKYRLIEDVERFPKFLRSIDKYVDETRLYRRCYRGLLSSYFFYDPEGNEVRGGGRQNWQRLRTYLDKHLQDIIAVGITPTDWVLAIQNHSNLLSDDPCSRYGQAFLDDRNDEFADVERRLQLSGASWVSKAVILAQLSAAVQCDDEKFKRYIPKLLALLDEERHTTFLDKGLAILLDRYNWIEPKVDHPMLRDFAVYHWKNPWLSINTSRWRLVSSDTRNMVADWLKLDLIKQFFELLTEEGRNDKRRLNFWARYHRRIDNMYFALGRYSMNNKKTDFVELRKKMEGRLLSLKEGGSSENNAFIMTIGDYVFIEFGMKGNAAFVYHKDKSYSFDLLKTKYVMISNLKKGNRDLQFIDRLIHTGKWEENFDLRLWDFGIRASDDELPEPWRSGDVLTINNYNSQNLIKFCHIFSIEMEDRRANGGQLWILVENTNRIIKKQMETWNFQYREGRGWYF
ncbi:MAG: hypothetical protein HQK79_21550 [Desulfobacterales bacterium]|nr:hypothetical protein [Desulfobacterales bacterium]